MLLTVSPTEFYPGGILVHETVQAGSDIKKSTPDKTHGSEILWSKRFLISKVR